MADETPSYVREHGSLAAAVRHLRLAGEIAELKREPGWQHDSRLAKTLSKEGPLAVVLSVMHAGARAEAHRVAGPVTLQCLEGTLRLQCEHESPLELTAGDVAVLNAGVTHSHEALTDCALLLTLAQP